MPDDESNPFLITPPPGLLPPPKRAPADDGVPTHTGSETRRIAPGAAPVPAFFPASPASTPPPAPAPSTPPQALLAPPAARVSTWVLALPGGVEHPITADGLALGRNPSPPADWPRATPLAVDDPGRSVSKTHALIALVDGSVRVTDLASTNGIAVSIQGVRTVVTASGTEVPDGATVELGSFAVGVRARAVS